MKNCFLSCFLLLHFALNAISQSALKSEQVFEYLDSLINIKSYFSARDYYHNNRHSLTQTQLLKSGAALDNVFNRLDSSNKKIETLFTNYAADLDEADRFRLLKIRQMNDSKLFNYRQAYNDVNEIVTKYASFMTADELDDYKNTRRIWAALANQPKQVVTITENTALKFIHDKAGLQNLKASLDTVSIDFIFDTGANLSTVTETTAKRMRMQLMDSVIEVLSITGLKVNARLGVCPVFNLGHIKVEHAVFLVFPDSSLAVPQINFQIHGIIGFPVIEALKEIQITRNGDFIVPVHKTVTRIRNLAIDFLNPVIDLEGESYTFDSGANSTLLYERYYQKYQSRIDSLYKETTISIGGAGGSISKKGYLIQFNTKVADRLVSLDSVQLFKEVIKADNYFLGNIGQDLIRKFNRMTLNFQDMFVKFD